MHRRFLHGVLALTLLGLTTGACSDDTATTPTTAAPDIINEAPFTGTLSVNGGATYPFAVTLAGAVTATVGGLDPNADGTLSIGLALGVWSGSSCQIVLANDNAGVGAGIIGAASGAGALCARVYDVGKLTVPVNFSISISHY